MLKMPIIFSDHMVLQRRKPIAVWGEADAKKQVRVLLKKGAQVLTEARTASDEHGVWALSLPAVEAAWGLSLEITSGEDSITCHDVLIGEVWIAGGQSNMEYLLHFDAEKDAALAKPDNYNIRFFDYPKVSYEGAPEDYDFSQFGFWRQCRREELPWFSAAGYYFAERLEAALGIPVGIVGCNWGGSRACSWMDESYLKGTPGEIWLEEYRKGIDGLDHDAYRRAFLANPANDHSHPIPGACPKITYPGLTREEQIAAVAAQAEQSAGDPYAKLIGPVHPWRPCGLYHTMLEKIAPYTAKGVLWYQGESDEFHPDIYHQVLTCLIQNWRALWREELPFLLVQLAPFGAWMDCTGETYPILRRCQETVARTVPGVFLCSNSDNGMRWDIHPKHKRPVGERLALLARGHIYGENILCDAPVFCGVRRSDDTAVLQFKNAAGLHIKGDVVNALLVNGQPCSGTVENDCLIVPLPAADLWHIEFANTGYYEVNLYNAANIPAIPFVAELPSNEP